MMLYFRAKVALRPLQHRFSIIPGKQRCTHLKPFLAMSLNAYLFFRPSIFTRASRFRRTILSQITIWLFGWRVALVPVASAEGIRTLSAVLYSPTNCRKTCFVFQWNKGVRSAIGSAKTTRPKIRRQTCTDVESAAAVSLRRLVSCCSFAHFANA